MVDSISDNRMKRQLQLAFMAVISQPNSIDKDNCALPISLVYSFEATPDASQLTWDNDPHFIKLWCLQRRSNPDLPTGKPPQHRRNHLLPGPSMCLTKFRLSFLNFSLMNPGFPSPQGQRIVPALNTFAPLLVSK